MKNKYEFTIALRLLIYLTVSLIVTTILTSLVSNIYSTCKTVVIGSSARFFDLKLFFYSIIKVFPNVLISESVLLLFFLIRHPTKSLVPIIFYTIITVAIWLFILPTLLKKSEISSANTSRENINISANLFREIKVNDEDYVFYYTKVSEENETSGVCFKLSNSDSNTFTDENTNAKNSNEVFTYNKLVLEDNDSGFNDSLVKTKLKFPRVVEILVDCYVSIDKHARNALNNSYWSWLCFCSLGLLLICVGGLRSISKWRFLNAICVAFVSFFFIWFNIKLLNGALFSAQNNDLCELFPFLPKGSNPFMIITNLLFSILFFFIGIIVRVIRKKNGYVVENSVAINSGEENDFELVYEEEMKRAKRNKKNKREKKIKIRKR